MKAILIFLFTGFIALSAAAQIGVEVKMGSTKSTFEGTQIFNNNESESTYYEIEDGDLHYYLVNNYEGKCIQFIHTECPIKSLDLKSVEYEDYQDMGQFMYISTKKNEKAVTISKTEDSQSRGASLDANLTTQEDESSTFMIIINNKEMAEQLLEAIKKG